MRTALQPSLILWMFDSRGECRPLHRHEAYVDYATDGRTQGANPQQLDDWVDPAVATWIEGETALMNEVWGPADTTRGALAFVHIPP